VAAAAVVVFAAALSASKARDTGYVVAARPLAAGSVIGPDDTTTANFRLSPATAAAAFRREAALIGRSVAVDLQPGELIQSSMLAAGGAARLRPVSVPVDADSLAALAVGQEVDVLSAPGSTAADPASQSPAAVSVVLRGATLLAVGRSGSGFLSGGGSGGTVVVTLGVTDLAEAEQLVQAAHSGTVELLRAEPGDGTGPGAGTGLGAGVSGASGPAAGGS
jgi:Flp pilus assembly protein CpaB